MRSPKKALLQEGTPGNSVAITMVSECCPGIGGQEGSWGSPEKERKNGWHTDFELEGSSRCNGEGRTPNMSAEAEQAGCKASKEPGLRRGRLPGSLVDLVDPNAARGPNCPYWASLGSPTLS